MPLCCTIRSRYISLSQFESSCTIASSHFCSILLENPPERSTYIPFFCVELLKLTCRTIPTFLWIHCTYYPFNCDKDVDETFCRDIFSCYEFPKKLCEFSQVVWATCNEYFKTKETCLHAAPSVAAPVCYTFAQYRSRYERIKLRNHLSITDSVYNIRMELGHTYLLNVF